MQVDNWNVLLTVLMWSHQLQNDLVSTQNCWSSDRLSLLRWTVIFQQLRKKRNASYFLMSFCLCSQKTKSLKWSFMNAQAPEQICWLRVRQLPSEAFYSTEYKPFRASFFLMPSNYYCTFEWRISRYKNTFPNCVYVWGTLHRWRLERKQPFLRNSSWTSMPSDLLMKGERFVLGKQQN